MRENCRKSLFIALFLCILAVLVFFSTLEDIQNPSDSTNSDSALEEQTDEESSKNYTSQTFSNLLNENASLEEILDFIKKHDFVGRWHITQTFQTPFDYFEASSGRMHFSFQSTKNFTRRYEFFLYDGEYIDRKLLWLRLQDGSCTSINSTSILCTQVKGNGIFQNHYEIQQKKPFDDINLTITVNIDEMKEMADPEKYINDFRMTFDLSPNPENISISFQASVQIDESLYHKTVRYALMVGGIAIIHSISCFMMIQKIMENEIEGSSYSIISLSFVAIWDMYLCIVNFLFAVRFEIYFHFLVTPAFCYFALFTVFETRLLMLIWKARYFPGQSNPEVLRNSLFKFYMKFYFFLTILLIMANNLITSNVFLFFVNLYLFPQIIHSAIKGQMIKPDKIFLFGLMLPRSFVVLYIKGCPYSIFEMTPSFLFVLSTLSILSIQILIVYLQEEFGPRFFLPKKFFPNTYDYFLNLPDRDLELCTETSEDCVICLNPLHHQPNISSERQNMVNNQPPYFQRLVNQRKVMQTPCQHKFHSICLLQWMSIKMECPTCRNPLPPL